MKIVQRVIQRIEITPDSYKLYFKVGRDYIDGKLASTSSLFSRSRAPKTKKAPPGKTREA